MTVQRASTGGPRLSRLLAQGEVHGLKHLHPVTPDPDRVGAAGIAGVGVLDLRLSVLFLLGEGRTINITMPTGNTPHDN